VLITGPGTIPEMKERKQGGKIIIKQKTSAVRPQMLSTYTHFRQNIIIARGISSPKIPHNKKQQQ